MDASNFINGYKNLLEDESKLKKDSRYHSFQILKKYFDSSQYAQDIIR